MVRTLNAAALLKAWEQAAAQPPVGRGSVLLAAAFPDRSADAWANSPLGLRDHALLRLYEGVFGSQLETTGQCPACQERLEVQFRPADISAPFANPEVIEREIQGIPVRFRVPSQADVAAALAAGGGRQVLIERCVEAVETLPAAVVEATVAAMAELDPQADIQIAVACPGCGREHEFAFDVAAYIWSELEDWAHRMIEEIHTLARAYHWREQDILEMSAFRRRMYLDLIEAEA